MYSISFQHVSFWCPLLDSHPTIHHSILGVCLQSHSKPCTSTSNHQHKLIQGEPGVCTDQGKELLVEASIHQEFIELHVWITSIKLILLLRKVVLYQHPSQNRHPKSCIRGTYWFQEYPPPEHQALVLVLGHLPVKTLNSNNFAYGIQWGIL